MIGSSLGTGHSWIGLKTKNNGGTAIVRRPQRVATRRTPRSAPHRKSETYVLSWCTQRGEAMQAARVGIREFRENLSSYLESNTPVAITRHGATIGIYVPTRPKPSQADLEALRVAGEKMQELIAAAGTTEDQLMADFKKLRRQRRKQQG